MKKILFLPIAIGMSSIAAASQFQSFEPKSSVPSIKDQVVSASFAQAYLEAYLRNPPKMTLIEQMPAFQSLKIAQQKLDAQREQLLKDICQVRQ